MLATRVTLLHLSDLQFGKNHRFAGVELSGLANPYDTLLARLWEDLQRLNKDHGVTPDLLLFTGDLAEWGMPDEFRSAREFLEKLTDKEHLNLPRHRVAIIPGNHDINRNACSAYFYNCAADGLSPVAPWWPKWRHYAAMFGEFYRDLPDAIFTAEKPWTLFEIPDIKVVIAGLNSTMADGHDCQKPGEPQDLKLPRHVGFCGEDQLKRVQSWLQGCQTKGWLRIGLVHHNVEADPAAEGNLEDNKDLKRLLAPCLNLLLHGHKHEAELGWLDNVCPVVATGSASLKSAQRPDEVPNQYQVIQVSARDLRVFKRCYFPERKEWGPDVRGAEAGITRKEIKFSQVSGAFPGRANEAAPTPELQTPGRKRRMKDPAIDLHNEEMEMDDAFVARVAEVCKYRRPTAAITPVRQPEQRLHYLRVMERADTIVRLYPVAVFEHGFTRGDLDRFLAVVDAPYRAADSGLISEIVYSGERPPEEVIREAERRRIRLQSFVEYQGLTDFTSYVRKQTDKLERDEIYPPALYVPQRMRFQIGQDENLVDDAFAQVQEWLLQPHPRFVLILGDFGTGKTFLLHELARRMGHDGAGLVPLFVELRALEKARTLEALVAQHLAAAGMERIDLAAFKYMLQQGRIVLFFDGFDELALRVSYDRAAEHFETLVQAAAGDAKVVVTSRTQHFESERQVRTVLYERAQPLPGLRYCKLQPFTETQIKRFLLNRWGGEMEAGHWFELLRHVKDLLGLSENPRMLGFITELKKEDIAKAKQREGVISAADLYRLLLERWLVFEYERAHPKGAQEILPRAARWAAVTAVALRLWEKTEKYVPAAEIAETTAVSVAKVMTTPPPADIAGHLIGSGSLFRRDDEGCFFFVHQSVMEWLVAREAAQEIKETGNSALLGTRALSPLMAEFLCDLTGREAAITWAVGIGAHRATGVDLAKNNALEVLKRLGVTLSLDLAGQDLRGKDFADQSLVGAELSGADLMEARLAGKDLSGAKLRKARLVRADLTKAVLTNATLESADLSEARLLGANLLGANLTGATLRRAALVSAKVEASSLSGLDTFGAALPESAVPLPCFSGSPSACNCVAWHAALGLVATGHDDDSVRLWEAASGKQLRQFQGHQSYVTSLVFSPDGHWLASGSEDKTIRLWEAATGTEMRQFKGQSPVRSVALSPNGHWLASGNNDNTVRLWEVSSQRALRQFRGHSGRVLSVAFSPGDGHWLASGGADNTVRLWEVASGKQLCQFQGHIDSVRSVAFSPDGHWLASGGGDNTVRLWEAASGNQLCQFQGHIDSVRSVAFSPDGKRLASASADHTVRLWDLASGVELRQYRGHLDSVRSVAFSPDGQRLASGSEDNTVRFWEAASGVELRQLRYHKNSVRSLAFSPDGHWLASGSADKTVQLWDAASGQELRRFQGHRSTVRSVAFSPDGHWLASGSADKTVRLWEAATGEELRQFQGQQDFVWSVAFSPDGHWLASGSDGKTVRLWEAASGTELRQFTGHQASVRSVVFSPDGRWLASGSADKTVRLWEAASGTELFQFTGHQASVWSVAFSPDGHRLVSASDDRTVRVWDIDSGKQLGRFTGHKSPILSVAFSLDGHWLASGSADRTVRLWQADSGRELHQFAGHQSSVRSVAFSPDGHWLASGSADNTVRLWNVGTGDCVAVLLPLPEGWVVFTPRGRYSFVGNVAGNFWHAISLCRFEVGELDEFIPELRLEPGERLLDIGPPIKAPFIP